MTVALTRGREASEAAVAALESLVDQRLDEQFRKFVSGNDGAIPEANSFPVNGVAHMGGVDKFIAVEDILSERAVIDDIAAHAYPIAQSAGGNYVLLDQGDGGAIYFWDHEIEGGTYRIADGLDAFLDLLEPFDVSAIKLVPGQVKSAWIDPDFLKQFGE